MTEQKEVFEPLSISVLPSMKRLLSAISYCETLRRKRNVTVSELMNEAFVAWFKTWYIPFAQWEVEYEVEESRKGRYFPPSPVRNESKNE
jgi:hypothetical protein